jgi:hypothetical protein
MRKRWQMVQLHNFQTKGEYRKGHQCMMMYVGCTATSETRRYLPSCKDTIMTARGPMQSTKSLNLNYNHPNQPIKNDSCVTCRR